MQSPASAIAYTIWARNRAGYLWCAAGLLALAAVYPMLFAYSRAWGTIIASAIPLIGIFGYILNSAIFAQEPGNLSSSYPRHMLILPVRCRTLVFWPMLYGALLAVIPWIFTAKVIYWSSGLTVPVLLPSLVLVVVVAWFQALAWAPLSVRWFRDIIAASATLGLGAVPIWILRSDPGAFSAVVAVLLAYLAGAVALANAALRADRRGDAWLGWFGGANAGRRAPRSVLQQVERAYASAARAQFGYEWRCHGPVLLGFLCGMMVLVWGCLLTAGKPIQAPMFPLILGLLLASPISAVGSLGPAAARFRPFWIEHRLSNTFLTVRPLESGGFVVAKMRLALVVVLVTWVFVLSGTALCFVLTRSLPAAMANWRVFASHYPGARAPLICVLVCILMPVAMWRLLTDGFAFVLTGRKWVADAAVFLYLAILTALVAGGFWVSNHLDQVPRLFAIAPWLVVFGAIIKAGLAAAAFRLAMRRRLISWPTFWGILATWLAFTVLGALLVILLEPPAGLGSKPAMILSIAAFVPLARFPLATLAFDWNRHR